MTSQVGEVSQGGAYQGRGRPRTEAGALVSSVALPFCSEVMKGGLVLGKVSVGKEHWRCLSQSPQVCKERLCTLKSCGC